MCLDDYVNGSQPQAGTLVDRFGGEEWLEDPLLGFEIRADPGVVDTKINIFSGDDLIRAALQRFVGCVFCFQINFTLLGHGIEGVIVKAPQDLVDLIFVGLDANQFLRRIAHTTLICFMIISKASEMSFTSYFKFTVLILNLPPRA